MKHVKEVSRKYELDPYWITHGCSQGSAEEWYQEHLVYQRDMLNNGSIEQFCSYLLKAADQARRAMQQQEQQAREAQLAKEALERQQAAIKARRHDEAEQARLAKERQQAKEQRLLQHQPQEAQRLQQQQQQVERARLQQEEQARLEALACRRCPARFSSNTKLHQHIEDHHAKKPRSGASSPPPALTPAPTAEETSAMPPLHLWKHQ